MNFPRSAEVRAVPISEVTCDTIKTINSGNLYVYIFQLIEINITVLVSVKHLECLSQILEDCNNDSMLRNILILTSSCSCSLLFFFIICRNSGKSIVPSPLRSTSITSSNTSSSVGFCPMERITPSNSLVEIDPLPS